MNFYPLLRLLLFGLPPETAHRLSMLALKSGLLPSPRAHYDPRLARRIAGLNFANPVGLAAGYDKNGEAPSALLRLGFGFVEIGTVTPRPQAGNARPRVFRLLEDKALVNRLGFNNSGHDAVLARLGRRAGRAGIIGVNIGANKDSPDFIADYVAGISAFWNVADYFTVNVSSPNTPGLRDLQQPDALAELLASVLARRDELSGEGGVKPVFLKLAPDLDNRRIDDISRIVTKTSIDGLILSNTTLERRDLKSQHAGETGGLSGRPLFERSTIILARIRQRVGSDLPIIGVGGIDSTETALAKLEAGADLLQLYTAMIYRGPGLATEIVRGLSAALDREGLDGIVRITGRRTDEWASRPLPDDA